MGWRWQGGAMAHPEVGSQPGPGRRRPGSECSRLEPFLSWAPMRSQSRRLSEEVFMPLGWASKASRRLRAAPPPLAVTSVTAQLRQGPFPCPSLGPDWPGQRARMGFFSAGQSPSPGKPESNASLGGRSCLQGEAEEAWNPGRGSLPYSSSRNSVT